MNQSIISSNGVSKITINGKTTIVKGNNISVRNGKIYVDGKEFKDHENLKDDYSILNITIEGNVESISKIGGSVKVLGNVAGDIDCGGSCTVDGSVDGSVDCGGSCTVDGNVAGDIDCGGSCRVRSNKR